MPLKESDFKMSLKSIRDLYRSGSGLSNFTALIAGETKSGKTSLLKTARLPVLVDMFDPRGELVLKDYIEQNKVFVRTFTNELSHKPVQYALWEEQWRKDIESGFLDNFGTYCIDSATTWIQAITNRVIEVSTAIAASKDRRHSYGKMEIGDYVTLYNIIRNIVKMTSTASCDFILTAHLVLDKDELTGEILYDLNVPKAMKTELPLLFSEYYCMVKRPKSDGTIAYKLLCNNQGRYRAGSRLASLGTIAVEEEANLKSIMKKAGLSTEDKPIPILEDV